MEPEGLTRAVLPRYPFLHTIPDRPFVFLVLDRRSRGVAVYLEPSS